MIGSYAMNFILLHLICGFTTAFIGIYILRWYFLGTTYGAILVGVIGAFLGALVGAFFFQNGFSYGEVLLSFLVSAAGLVLFRQVSRHHPD